MTQRRQKRLNLYNSDRFYNLVLHTKDNFQNFIYVNESNKKQIENRFTAYKQKVGELPGLPYRDSQTYLVTLDISTDEELIAQIFAHGGKVGVVTSTTINERYFPYLARRKGSFVVYQNLIGTDEYVRNVRESFKVATTYLDLAVDIKQCDPYVLLFTLHDFKTFINHVYFTFLPTTPKSMNSQSKGSYFLKTKYKFRYFKYIQTSLSIWAMNIHVVCDSSNEKKYIQSLIAKDKGNKGVTL